MEGYTIALDLLPQVAWLGQTIPARQRRLTSTGDIACEAAAAAISAEQYVTALEWLEQGRSIVWSQLLSLRTPVDALRDVDPSLAENLLCVSRALEHAGSRHEDFLDLPAESSQRLSVEQIAQGHRRLAEEWERLVRRARDIKGFEDFLQPKKFAQLCSAAETGTVVVINVHKKCCDALALVAGLDEVVHIPLHNFSYEEAKGLHTSLKRILLATGAREPEDTRGTRVLAATTKNEVFQAVLSKLWVCIVKPVLDSLAFSVSCSYYILLELIN